MRPHLAAIVEWKSLWKVIVYSLVSGVGIAVIFGAGVSSAAGFLDALRQRRTAAGAAWAGLAVLCLAGALAAVVFGYLLIGPF